jgi:hypothetical protein
MYNLASMAACFPSEIIGPDSSAAVRAAVVTGFTCVTNVRRVSSRNRVSTVPSAHPPMSDLVNNSNLSLLKKMEIKRNVGLGGVSQKT